MLVYASIFLGVLVLVLAYACRRLWLSTQNSELREYTSSLQGQVTAASRLLREQEDVLVQLGELFDHAGVALERSEHKQASDDLMRLGSILRSLHHGPHSPFGLASAQETLAEMGERYGIEPRSGGQFCMRTLVRIAEEILEGTLTQRAAA